MKTNFATPLLFLSRDYVQEFDHRQQRHPIASVCKVQISLRSYFYQKNSVKETQQFSMQNGCGPETFVDNSTRKTKSLHVSIVQMVPNKSKPVLQESGRRTYIICASLLQLSERISGGTMSVFFATQMQSAQAVHMLQLALHESATPSARPQAGWYI